MGGRVRFFPPSLVYVFYIPTWYGMYGSVKLPSSALDTFLPIYWLTAGIANHWTGVRGYRKPCCKVCCSDRHCTGCSKCIKCVNGPTRKGRSSKEIIDLESSVLCTTYVVADATFLLAPQGELRRPGGADRGHQREPAQPAHRGLQEEHPL